MADALMNSKECTEGILNAEFSAMLSSDVFEESAALYQGGARSLRRARDDLGLSFHQFVACKIEKIHREIGKLRRTFLVNAASTKLEVLA